MASFLVKNEVLNEEGICDVIDGFKLELLSLSGCVNFEAIEVEKLQCGKCEAISFFYCNFIYFWKWVFAVRMAWKILNWVHFALECYLIFVKLMV